MPRIRKAWSIKVKGVDAVDAVCRYAATASQARAQTISDLMDAWGCTWAEAMGEIEYCHREPARDLTLPDRHPLAPALPPEILHCVTHAYGGTGEKAGYRDHFYATVDDCELRAGTYHGLFKAYRRDKGRNGAPDYIMYALTDLGKNVAAGEVETYPRH